MKLLLILTTLYFYLEFACLQGTNEECRADMFPDECPYLITLSTPTACYLQDLGGGMPSIFNLCCETCRKQRNPLAPPGCEYGDRSLFCSEQNCTVPARNDTRICCKTCQASLEADVNSTINPTTQAANEATSNLMESTTNSPQSNTTTIYTTAKEEITSTTTVESTSVSHRTTETMTMSTTQQAVSTTTNAELPSTTTKEPTNPTKDEKPVDDCQDLTDCDNIVTAQCYSKYVQNKCCAKCKDIAKTNPKDCKYGDRHPTWCRKLYSRYPRYVCTLHENSCCKTCANSNVNSHRVVIITRQPTRLWRIKWKSSNKRSKNWKKSTKRGRKPIFGRRLWIWRKRN